MLGNIGDWRIPKPGRPLYIWKEINSKLLKVVRNLVSL